MIEEQAIQRAGTLTDAQLKKLIEKQDALSMEDFIDGLFSFSVHGFTDDENEVSTESIYERGEAARIVLAKRKQARGALTDHDRLRSQRAREERLQRSLCGVEESLEVLGRTIRAKRVWLSQSGMDYESRAYRSTATEIEEMLEKQRKLRERRQQLSALTQSFAPA